MAEVGPMPGCMGPGGLPDTGDTAWVLISTTLVLLMVPGLAFFEAGLLRSKNTLSIVKQVFGGFCVLNMMWYLFGFSFVFGPNAGDFIGDVHNFFFMNLGNMCLDGAPYIPGLVYAAFQSKFACITPLLITGAFAERINFMTAISYMAVWELIVYYPVAHWIWGGGWLGQHGVLDFAGGIIIHTMAGVSSVVVSLMLGKRVDFDQKRGEYLPSSVPLSAVGVTMLWCGWYGFNAGSALTAGQVAAYTAVNTTLASVTCGLVWMYLSHRQYHRVRSIDILNGIVAGLAGITPASGFVQPYFAIVLALIIGPASWFSSQYLKTRIQIDDALDVGSVHGVSGMVGSIGLGFFADPDVNPPSGFYSTGGSSVIHGYGKQLGWQILAVLIAGLWAGFWTYIILKVKDLFFGGLRVEANREEQGLDATEQYSAYNEMLSAKHNPLDIGGAAAPQAPQVQKPTMSPQGQGSSAMQLRPQQTATELTAVQSQLS